jgi:HAMP domain-containing protein
MAKKYSLNVENDKIISVEVDGVVYQRAALIPDPADRRQIRRMIAKSPCEAETESAQVSDDLGKIILPLFLGISLLMLAIASLFSYFALRSLSREVSVRGNVVNLIERSNPEGQVFYYPVVEFPLPDKSVQTVIVAEGSFPPAYVKGQAVPIGYDPAKPLNARIKSGPGAFGAWIVPIISGILGLAFLGATFFARWVLKQEPEEIESIGDKDE